MNQERQIRLEINMEDIKEILSERDLAILQLRSTVRALKEQLEGVLAQNEALRRDIEKLQKGTGLKKVE